MRIKRQKLWKRIKLLRGVTATGIVALVLGAPATNSGSSDNQTPGESPPAAPSVQLATELPSPPGGVTKTTAEAQSALKVSTIVQNATQTLGTSYAGLWIDNSTSPSTVHVMVAGTSDASSAESFKANLATARYIEVTNVKYSQVQLLEYQSILATYAAANFVGPNAPKYSVSISPDPLDNAVKVTLSPTDASILTNFQSLVPSDALRVQWKTMKRRSRGGPGWTSTVTRSSYPPYKAGLSGCLWRAPHWRAG